MSRTTSVSRSPQAKVGAGVTAHLSTPATDIGLKNFFELLRRELTVPLREISHHAGRIESLRAAGLVPTTLAGEQAFAELADTSRRTVGFIERLINLGDFLIDPPLQDEERLLLDTILRTAAAQTNESCRSRNISLRIEDGSDLLAPVYGSRRWITLALRHLLESLIESAPANAHILVRLRQTGMHQLMVGSIQHGRPTPTSRDLLPQQRSRHPAGIATATDSAQLDLAMVHAIIELHGGMFKTDTTEDGKLHQFTFTLPTGLPARENRRPACTSCQLRQQSLQYANDLAILMATSGDANTRTETHP